VCLKYKTFEVSYGYYCKASISELCVQMTEVSIQNYPHHTHCYEWLYLKYEAFGMSGYTTG